MLSDEVRRRLEALNRSPLPALSPCSLEPLALASPALAVSHAATTVSLTLPTSELPFASSRQPSSRGKVPPTAALAEVIGGHEETTTSGLHWRVRRPLQEIWPAGTARLAEFSGQQPEPRIDSEQHPELLALDGHLSGGVLYLDLETCGFAGSTLFLIGLVWKSGDEWVLDQLLARNYAEERASLETLWSIVAQNRVLATFNGKCFDWPMVHDRSTLHRLGRANPSVRQPSAPLSLPLGPNDPRPDLIHCDLLHHARRAWRHRLPNCKLQTLERYLCRRVRQADIAGADIPAVYHEFVRSGNPGPLRSILHHNALDLVTLLEVSLRLCSRKAA